MDKFPFSISEVRDMYKQGDTYSMIGIIIVLISPILIFISWVIKQYYFELYSPWQPIIIFFIFLCSIAFVYLYRAWFLAQFDNKADSIAIEIETKNKNNPGKEIMEILVEYRSINKELYKLVVDRLVSMGLLIYKKDMK